MEDKLDRLTPNVFKNGPGQFLINTIVSILREEEHWKLIFGESIDSYDREDFSIRELPAMRVYNQIYTKEHESHYINGDFYIDVIFPATLRREQTEDYASTIGTAMLQQFRRPSFFSALLDAVPGLNECGKVFTVDKSLVFQNTKMTDECPLLHMTLNFRIDQKEWDAYLERVGRTRDEPFDVTLENLRLIASEIAALRGEDVTTTEITLHSQQKVGG